jgi:flagellar biosynthesis/type III secretory pathway protein FliH
MAAYGSTPQQGTYDDDTMDAKGHGYQHGYRDGLRQGRADMSRNMPFNYESEDYQRGDFGYEEYMGSHKDFQRGYRDGFKAGYDDGYHSRPIRNDVYRLNEGYDPDARREEEPDRYPNAGFNDAAYDNGYRDGLKAGQDDFRNRKDFKPERHDSYEHADHGYHSRYGNKNDYKEQYRKGYMRGYEDAFPRTQH